MRQRPAITCFSELVNGSSRDSVTTVSPFGNGNINAIGGVGNFFYGGDAYSAPMVLQRSLNGGSWTLYNIGRDYLGSITDITDADGTVVAQYRYDPWGRLVNPLSGAPYQAGGEPSLFLGRGFTGHEYLPWFGLINANARLYDPLLGRLLSPDPYVQDPDNPQNFNRYSYCLNNPLRYTDESGEFVGTMLAIGVVSAYVFGFGNLLAHIIRGDDLSNGNWAKYFYSGALAGFIVGAATFAGISGLATLAAKGGAIGFIGKIGLWGYAGLQGTSGVVTMAGVIGGAINKGWEGVANAAKIMIGNYYLDENKSFFGQAWEGILRHTWEYPQQSLGYSFAEISNCWSDRVDYWGGATFVTNFSTKVRQGVTIGSNIYIDNNDEAVMESYPTFDDYMISGTDMAEEYYIHEYGHTIQSKKWGSAYLVPGLLSLWNCRERLFTKNKIAHDDYWTEVWANTYSKNYFKKHFPAVAFPSTLKVKY